MTKYKCAQALCKYTSDKPGDCCGQSLAKTDGTMYRCTQKDCKYRSDKPGECCGKSLEKIECDSSCSCC